MHVNIYANFTSKALSKYCAKLIVYFYFIETLKN